MARNDVSRGDATFNNPLYDSLRKESAQRYGIDLSNANSPTSAMIHTRVTDQKLRDDVEQLAIVFIMAAASILSFGKTGDVIGGGVDVLVANHKADAAQAGVFVGTNSQAVANREARSADIDTLQALHGLASGGQASKANKALDLATDIAKAGATHIGKEKVVKEELNNALDPIDP